jgi:hypothetical protein
MLTEDVGVDILTKHSLIYNLQIMYRPWITISAPLHYVWWNHPVMREV